MINLRRLICWFMWGVWAGSHFHNLAQIIWFINWSTIDSYAFLSPISFNSNIDLKFFSCSTQIHQFASCLAQLALLGLGQLYLIRWTFLISITNQKHLNPVACWAVCVCVNYICMDNHTNAHLHVQKKH